MGLDRLLLLVDPAVRLGLLHHGAEIALPCGVAGDLGPLPQRLLVNPGGGLVRQFGGVGERAPGLIKPGRAALNLPA